MLYDYLGFDNTVSDKNNQFSYFVKDIKVEQNDLDKMHTSQNDISIKQNKGKRFQIIKIKQNILKLLPIFWSIEIVLSVVYNLSKSFCSTFMSFTQS